MALRESRSLPAIVYIHGHHVKQPEDEQRTADITQRLPKLLTTHGPHRRWLVKGASRAWLKGYEADRESFKSALVFAEMKLQDALRVSKGLGLGVPNSLVTFAACECILALLTAMGEAQRPLVRIVCSELFRAIYKECSDYGAEGSAIPRPLLSHTTYYDALAREASDLEHARRSSDQSREVVLEQRARLDRVVGSLEQLLAKISSADDEATSLEDALGALEAIRDEVREQLARLATALRRLVQSPPELVTDLIDELDEQAQLYCLTAIAKGPLALAVERMPAADAGRLLQHALSRVGTCLAGLAAGWPGRDSRRAGWAAMLLLLLLLLQAQALWPRCWPPPLQERTTIVARR